MLKKVLTIGVAACFLLSCFGNDKTANAQAEDQIELPAQVIGAAYEYASRFPAKEVKPLLDALEAQAKVNQGKEKFSVSYAHMKTIYDALMKDQSVQLIMALQDALQKHDAAKAEKAPAATPTPEAKKDAKK